MGVIGNQVWYETGTSVNGLYEPGAGDIGIEGVTMELLDASNQLIGTQVTGPSGDYAFTSLAAGTYKVQVGSSVTYPNNAAILGAYQPTTIVAGVADDTNKAQPYNVTLATNTSSNLTADFGYRDVPPAALGDRVWYDAHKNGFQDVGEPGIGNVDLNLYLDNGTTPGVFDAGDTLVGTQTTGADGGYIFTGLVPGTYFVDVVNATVPAGYIHFVGHQSLIDPTGPITLAAGEFNENVDFAYYKAPGGSNAVIGDSVWYDYDADGIRDPNEPGIPGVTVLVTDSNGATYGGVTDANGNYTIVVPTGPTLTYIVQPILGLPGGLTATTPVPQGVPPLAPGQQYLNADFGYDSADLGVIGNQVWKDTTPDGIFGAGEPGLPGVSVDLWRNPDGSATFNGDETLAATTTTDTAGQYAFQGVPAGAYLVLVSDTANVLTDYLPSATQFPPSATDNLNRVQPYPVSLTAGATNNTADFGYVLNPDRPERGRDRQPSVV